MIEENYKYVITFDIEWAPDFAIQYCLELLDRFNVKATFFATHRTDYNKEIIKKGHILGIHPNFLPSSSHGNEVKEIINNCLNFSPDAWCMRSHSLVQSSPLLHDIFKQYPQLTLDVSLFMHRSNFAHLVKWDFYGVEFDRLLYNWEDDAEFSKQRFSDSDDLFFGKLTVYDFHPIHVYLNSSNGTEYASLKESLSGKSIADTSMSHAHPFKNRGNGTETFLRRILKSDANSITLDKIK